jgi:hypothetical protein
LKSTPEASIPSFKALKHAARESFRTWVLFFLGKLELKPA